MSSVDYFCSVVITMMTIVRSSRQIVMMIRKKPFPCRAAKFFYKIEKSENSFVWNSVFLVLQLL